MRSPRRSHLIWIDGYEVTQTAKQTASDDTEGE